MKLNILSHKRTLVRVSILILLVLAAFLIARHFISGSNKPEYIWHTVERESIENVIAASGSLEPKDYVEVGAQGLRPAGESGR